MAEIKFKELKASINKREKVGFDYNPKNDAVIKKLEPLLFGEGLVKKITLEDTQLPDLYRTYRISTLYTTKDSSEGAILSLESIKGFETRNDYSFYLIGNKEFKEKMKKVFQDNILKFNSPKPL